MGHHRWPRSLHSQAEAVLQGIRTFRQKKTESPKGLRSYGSWRVYKYETHRFVRYLQDKRRTSLLDTLAVAEDMATYLAWKIDDYVAKKRSRQTLETLLSALGKFEYALNLYIETHNLDIKPLETSDLRMACYDRGKLHLKISSKLFANRAYPDPVRLIQQITNPTFQLQASLQYEGGLRAEGVGAPSNCRLQNPLTAKGLCGIGIDPVTNKTIGIVVAREKGGKESEHFVSPETYKRLERYIQENERLESDYHAYIAAINQAAKATGQFATGRGSHGLKHNFAQERYLECIDHGLTHEQALQQTSLETSHFRMSETLTYTAG